MTDEPLLYRYADAARLLGVSVRTVRRLVATRQIVTVTVGSSPRIARTELLRLVATPTNPQQEAL